MLVFLTGRTDVGQGRQNNEDCYLIMDGDDSIQFFAVADGMGGHNGGEVASSMAIELGKSFFLRNKERLIELSFQNVNQFITDLFEQANESVWNKALENEHLAGMGTTLTLGIIMGSHLHVGHIGDSRAYIISLGNIIQLTEDHSYVQKLVNENQLKAGEEKNHPKQNLLTRALGTDYSVEVDIYHYSLKPGDYVLLCTDGLTRMVSDEEILDIINSCPGSEAADRLISTANARGGPDNITVLLVGLSNEDQ
ncbi:Stp1/IreP family PP2C-type Ser/Thr phosphatase [Candidatus Contubernalis alkaliaceticus]|uniref:Stp1/IreP family PP2C-type Ser/Thr phosphatase n=1 Tax=Candidatus Contubernalis alkaliaceticus TaxID=338645 RepID=UPI001F4C4808|nr:Stp1/IreP family PP2C-type Ser/Thr phosphatase [Candidatus Contubernalis alkalaceticus]UNC92783.1 Stp1/IreP family PP2C-type Ser/Thr phosphatase [Candidatus Contubernalis alkalaceticus]